MEEYEFNIFAADMRMDSSFRRAIWWSEFVDEIITDWENAGAPYGGISVQQDHALRGVGIALSWTMKDGRECAVRIFANPRNVSRKVERGLNLAFESSPYVSANFSLSGQTVHGWGDNHSYTPFSKQEVELIKALESPTSYVEGRAAEKQKLTDLIELYLTKRSVSEPSDNKIVFPISEEDVEKTRQAIKETKNDLSKLNEVTDE